MTAGGCSQLRETKIKHPVHRLLRQNHNIIIFEDENEMKKESVLKCCKLLEFGECAQWGRGFCKNCLGR